MTVASVRTPHRAVSSSIEQNGKRRNGAGCALRKKPAPSERSTPAILACVRSCSGSTGSDNVTPTKNPPSGLAKRWEGMNSSKAETIASARGPIQAFQTRDLLG